MKIKILSIIIIAMLTLSNAILLFSIYSKAFEVEPIWPDDDPETNWFQFDTNDSNDWPNQEYRDVRNASYFIDVNYIYFRLECYGNPNFTDHPNSRYKWYIDIDKPYDMYGSGNTIYEAEYLLFVEDSKNPERDGIVDIYLLNDTENDGFPTGKSYLTDPGPILDPNVTGYRTEGKYLDLYILRENISNPRNIYFTWATDQGDPNLGSSNGELSEHFFNETISKSDIEINKTSSKDKIYAGESFTYTLKITNNGPHNASYVNVTDILPENVTFTSSNPPPKLIENNQILYWDLINLNTGESRNITINVTADENKTGIIINKATAINGKYDPRPDNNYDEIAIEIKQADLSIVKSDSADPVYYGETFNYSLRVKNNGPDNALNVTVIDVLPKEVSFINAHPPTTSSAGSNLTWELGNILVKSCKYINITVKVNTTNIGNITNNACVTSDTIDPFLGNNSICEITFVNFSAELSVIKTCDTELVIDESNLTYAIAGGNLTYTINVTNLGPHTAENITVTDILPINVSFVSSYPPPSYNIGQMYQWNYSKLEAYYSSFIILNVTINNGTVGIVSNQVTVTSDTHDINDGNDNDTENTTVKGVADISIQKTAEAKTPIYAGDYITYILNVTNHGPDQALIVNITDMLPPEVTFTNSTIEKSGNNNSRYFWIIPSINISDSVIIKINVTINNGVSGEITNYAFVTEDSHDPVPGNNSDEIKITVNKKSTGGGSGGSSSSSDGSTDDTDTVVTYYDPTAITDGPYYAYVDEEIQLDGSASHDNDENGSSIVRYDWKFSDDIDWQNDTNATPVYTYNLPGTYNISLRVFDDEGSCGINTTFSIIVKANYPPGNPKITGPENGTLNVSYNFSVVSIDADGDELKYIIDWGDGTITESDFLASGIVFNSAHKWIKFGTYTITVRASDNESISTDKLTIEINEPAKSEFPCLLFLLILSLIIILLFIFLEKRHREKKKQEELKSTAKKASTKQ